MAYTYLDYAAMAPLCREAVDAMCPYMESPDDIEGMLALGMNPNSLHTPGRNAFKALEGARREVAAAIGADRPNSVVFTSGATEADNMAVKGIAHAAWDRLKGTPHGARDGSKGAVAGAEGPLRKPHVVVSAIEHDAVLESAADLRRDGFAVDIVRPDRDGFIEARRLEQLLESIEDSGDAAVLISIQTANSEIGSIQPVRQLCSCAHSHGAMFHTDATQALGKIEVDVSSWDVDAASFSSHKVGGPKGIGALYVRRGTPIRPLIAGGGQEGTLRSGTQDVCSAVGFAAACAAATEALECESPREMELRDDLYERLGSIDPIQPAVPVDRGSRDYLPNIVNVLFCGFESNLLVARYDALGFAVSGGSACSSDSTDVSHVLKAIGVPDDQALGEVRISLGRLTDRSDIDRFLHATMQVLDWNNRTQGGNDGN